MKNKTQNNGVSKRPSYKGEIFIKLMAGFLALLMVAGTAFTLIYALMR